jgi:hypothetical protein
LRAVGDQHNDIALGAQFDIFPRRGDAIFKCQPTLWCYRHVHKEVDVCANVTLLQAAIMQAGAEEVIAATVHVPFIQRITHGVALLRAGATEGVVATAGISDNGQQRVAKVGVQHAATGEIGVVSADATCAGGS